MLAQYTFLQLQTLIAEIYQGRRVDIRPFAYVFDFPTIPVGTEAVATNKIIGNADFLVCSMAASSTGGFTAAPGCLLQILDNGTQENFFDSPVPIDQVAMIKTGELTNSYRGLSYPRKVAGNSLLTATIAVQANGTELTTPQLYLDGVSVYVY